MYSNARLCLASCLLAAAPVPKALGQAAQAAAPADVATQAQAALRYLGRLDRPSDLEPAGAHGSRGVEVGAGGATYAAAPDNAVLRSLIGQKDATTGPVAAPAVPRAWLVKGLPLPVDLGVSAGAPVGANFTQVSGSLQWTVYEAFAMPALAVRASYGRLFGLSGTTLASTGGEAVASYGFLRYLTIYGAAGLTQHQGRISIQPDSSLSGFLAADQPSAEVSETWTEPVRSLGLQIVVVPPFIALTGEAEMAGSARDYAVKLSVGL